MTTSSLTVTQFVWLMLTAFVMALLARRFKVPYALCLVMTGIAVGAARLLPHAHLSPDLLLTVFLPPLLFESALHLHLEQLRRDWKPIAIYTLAGTMLSTLVIGLLCAWLMHLTLTIGLVFGALISTTDPISVIAIFKRLQAGRRLTLMLEAESLFNNDIAVVLFIVVLGAVHGTSVGLGQSAFLFFRLVIGGMALGLGFGLLASRMHYELDDHLIEITLTTVVAFGSYLCADALGVSGVMACIVAGLVVGNYGMPTTMTPGTRLAVVSFWEYGAFVAESLTFLLLGIEASYVDWTGKLWYTLAAIPIVLVGRCGIYPLSLLVNRLGDRVPPAWQHVLVWGGLRGALSIALVLSLAPEFPQRDILVAATVGVVLFSLLVQGLTVGKLLTCLHLGKEQASEGRDTRRLSSEIAGSQRALDELERIRQYESYPDWMVENLIEDYQRRIAVLKWDLDPYRPAASVSEDLKMAELRGIALRAEKNALQEAARQGQLDGDDWHHASRRIDAELFALTMRGDAG